MRHPARKHHQLGPPGRPGERGPVCAPARDLFFKPGNSVGSYPATAGCVRALKLWLGGHAPASTPVNTCSSPPYAHGWGASTAYVSLDWSR